MIVEKVNTMFGRQPNELFKPEDKSDFYISFNPDTRTMGMMLGGTGAETALCDRRNGTKRFYILNGDWREGYRPLVDKGFDACLAFYKANIEHKSDWSD